jgi:hypothetical protein
MISFKVKRMTTKNLFGLREASLDPCLEGPVKADINMKKAPNNAPIISILMRISMDMKQSSGWKCMYSNNT